METLSLLVRSLLRHKNITIQPKAALIITINLYLCNVPLVIVLEINKEKNNVVKFGGAVRVSGKNLRYFPGSH